MYRAGVIKLCWAPPPGDWSLALGGEIFLYEIYIYFERNMDEM
jgi:hypothetical protein